MKKFAISAIVAVFIAAAGGALWFFWPGFVGERTEHEGREEDDHESEDRAEHGDEERARLSEAELREFEITTAAAEPGSLLLELSLPGEVVFNPNQVAHVVPRAPGVVREVHFTVGDTVRGGDLLAVLDSRELARTKATYLAALARLDLAQANFDREGNLLKRKIASEATYLAAKQALEEARIQRDAAERELHTLGLSDEDVAALPTQTHDQLTRYEMRAPIAGIITSRHLTRGEVVPEQPEDPPFVIADASNVWVYLTVYQEHMDTVQVGQKVSVAVRRSQGPQATGKIDYVSPLVEVETRTATARVVLENPERRWRPGMFVTGKIAVRQLQVGIAVPRTALQMLEGESVVFIQTQDGFEPRPVKTGQSDTTHTEIVSGLEAGERYAATNAFVLKAELKKGTFGGGHAH